MDILTIFTSYAIMAILIKIAIDILNKIILPFYNIQRYSMLSVFILTAFTMLTYNMGLMEALKIPISQSYVGLFHYCDLIISVLCVSGGINSIHQAINGITEYKTNKKVDSTK